MISATDHSFNSTAPSRRSLILQELLTSEIRYDQNLVLLRQFYYDPLLSQTATTNTSSSQIIAKRTIQEIFGNIHDIFTLTGKVKCALEQRICGADELDTCCVGDIMLELAPYMSLYSLYIMNFRKSLELVEVLVERNSTFKAFVKRAISKSERYQLGLQALLLEPVQRLPRYKLIIESLLRHTNSSHPDYFNLCKSLIIIQQVVSSINEKVRSNESLIILLALQKQLVGFTGNLITPGRALVKQGEVMKVCRKNHQERIFLLLTDLLIYGSKGVNEKEVIFHRKIDLELVSVEDVPDLYGIRYAFRIISTVKSFTVYAESYESKMSWFNAFRTTIDALHTARQTLVPARCEESRIKKQLSYVYQSPVWVPDHTSDTCMSCKSSFSLFFKRKHHCRKCGLLFCYLCLQNDFVVPGFDEDRVMKCCNACLLVIRGEGLMDTLDQDGESVVNEKRESMEVVMNLSGIGRVSSECAATPVLRKRVYDGSRPLSYAPQLWNGLARFSFSALVAQPTVIDRNRMSLDAPSRKSVADEKSILECFLCQELFSMARWRYVCGVCSKMCCASCVKQLKQTTTCEPCAKGIDPQNVVIRQRGSGWSCFV